MKKIIKKLYFCMQQHYITFRLLVWLKELGITRRINFLILHGNDKKLVFSPSEEILRSRDFFDKNSKRVLTVLRLLADEKSKMVWGGVLNYRLYRKPLSSKLYSEHDQYFCNDIIHLVNDEVFIDGGAYTGDTIQQFLDTANKNNITVNRIIAFEPEAKNYKLISKFYGNRKNILVINKGLSVREDKLYFKETGVSSALVRSKEEATTIIPVISIDAVPECKEATFIKMDIEGSEMDALKGAEETIKRNHPKLAICIYHSDEDMIRIIEYVHKLVPEYQLYVRHHSKSEVETVLYAVMNKL